MKQLKKAYYSKALLYHPDKNNRTSKKFIEINQAYQFLQNNIKNNNGLHFSLFNHFNYIKQIIEKKSLDFLTKINVHVLLNIYKFLCDFDIPEEMLIKIKNIIETKIQKDRIILLNPTLDNLMDKKVYQLQLYGETVYIPLWHRELYYDISGINLLIKCIPETQYKLDSNNNIYITVTCQIADILKNEYLEILINKKKYKIMSKELNILKKQHYIIKNSGIPRMNHDDIYNCDKISNIYVSLLLS